MGTAYEYYVKRRTLARFLTGRPHPRTVLIAGLPEKYGASLDFLLLGSELGAAVTVIDDRPAAIERLRGAIEAASKMPGPALKPPAAIVQGDLATLSTLSGGYDLALSSEVLQRLSSGERHSYVARLGRLAAAAALFCPNAGNEAHNSISGLAGLRLEEMQALTADRRPLTIDELAVSGRRSAVVSSGYIDMPPFPPGITRSAEQREEATSGRFEALVMWGLGRYAHVERLLPKRLRQRQSHIVYAFLESTR